MRKRSYGYLAGILDGDGGIYICKSMVNGCDTYQAQMCVANADTTLMGWLKHHFGGCVVRNSAKVDTPNFGSVVAKKYQNRTDNWQWRLTGNRRLSDVLPKLLPYLRVNEQKGWTALALTKLHGKYRASRAREQCFVAHQQAQPVTRKDKKAAFSYFAGLLDAEGSISVVRATKPESYRILVRISNDNRSLVDWIEEFFRGKVYSHREGVRIRYTWYCKEIDETRLESFLLAIIPYLIVKRPQALLALSLIRTSPSERTIESCEKIRNEIICLNASFGSVETNTPTCSSSEQKIESKLTGDCKNSSVVTQLTC